MSRLCVVSMVCVAFAFLGCGVRKDSSTVNSANVHKNCVQTSQGLICNEDSEKQFASCMSNNAPTMGSSHADAYCRCVTTGGIVVPSQHPQLPPTCVAAGGAAVGGAYPGGMMMPGQRGAILLPDMTSPGAVAMENNSRGARVYVLPGSQLPGGTSTPDAGADTADLARSQIEQQKAICRIKPDDPICCTSCGKK